MMLGTLLGGLPTSTLPGINARQREHTRDGHHIRVNADRAFYDSSAQETDSSGQPAFLELNGHKIPKCSYYYIGKDKDSIGGPGIGGDPKVDTIDHPFVQFYECYKWNGTRYVNDWTPMNRRLEAALNVCPISYVIPGIPWAFQRGMRFVSENDPQAIRRISGTLPAEYEGKFYPDWMRESPYGNELTPDRLSDYGAFLEAAVRQLLANSRTGKMARTWKWKIGQEVDTRFYTQKRYFELYKTAATAIRRALPEAKVGVHFGIVQPDDGWLPPFLRFCKQNKLPCDFIGASRYYQISLQKKSDPESIENWLKSVPEMTNWPAGAKLEIHEFGIKPVPGASDQEVQKMPFYAMLADRVMQTPAFGEWITVRSASDVCLGWLQSVVGQELLKSTRKGAASANGACIGAMMAKPSATNRISALVYNYNPNADETSVEKVQISFKGFKAATNRKLLINVYRYDKLLTSSSVDAEKLPLNGLLSTSVALPANSLAILFSE